MSSHTGVHRSHDLPPPCTATSHRSPERPSGRGSGRLPFTQHLEVFSTSSRPYYTLVEVLKRSLCISFNPPTILWIGNYYYIPWGSNLSLRERRVLLVVLSEQEADTGAQPGLCCTAGTCCRRPPPSQLWPWEHLAETERWPGGSDQAQGPAAYLSSKGVATWDSCLVSRLDESHKNIKVTDGNPKIHIPEKNY